MRFWRHCHTHSCERPSGDRSPTQIIVHLQLHRMVSLHMIFGPGHEMTSWKYISGNETDWGGIEVAWDELECRHTLRGGNHELVGSLFNIVIALYTQATSV